MPSKTGRGRIRNEAEETFKKRLTRMLLLSTLGITTLRQSKVLQPSANNADLLVCNPRLKELNPIFPTQSLLSTLLDPYFGWLKATIEAFPRGGCYMAVFCNAHPPFRE